MFYDRPDYVVLPHQALPDGLNIFELMAKINQATDIIKENERLREQVSELTKQRDELLEVSGFLFDDEAFLAPSFPEDFDSYEGCCDLTDDQIQDVVIEASEVDLEEGEFTAIHVGNTIVFKYVDSGNTYTVVAKNFLENVQFDTHEYVEDECGEDCPCIG